MSDKPNLAEQRATADLLKALFPLISKAVGKESEELKGRGQKDLGDALLQAVTPLKALVFAYFDMTRGARE